MGYGVINTDGVTLEFTNPENGETFHFPPKVEERLGVDILLNAKSITVLREFGWMELVRQIVEQANMRSTQ